MSEKAHSKQLEIYRNMTPEQKWAIVNDLYASAWELKAAGVRTQHPDWSEEDVQRKVREIFLYATT